MYTRTLLERLLVDQYSTEIYQKPYDEEESKFIRYRLHCFLSEFSIAWVLKPYTGYYITNINDRTIQGLGPINTKEFLLFLLYSSMIIFVDPKSDLSIDFVEKVSTFYELSKDETLEFLDRAKSYTNE